MLIGEKKIACPLRRGMIGGSSYNIFVSFADTYATNSFFAHVKFFHQFFCCQAVRIVFYVNHFVCAKFCKPALSSPTYFD